MNFESLLNSQERGSNARILGLSAADNPYADSDVEGRHEDERNVLYEAWAFGWEMEDTVRRIDTGIYGFLRVEAALAGLSAPRT
ncbi:CrpP-related protein [Affinirhizobium pseudoryzae]|uniref:CrpP-related protein n=1 Tax=Allorhizobium pseudoryzae TaxID=379684 RepID=UPI0019D2BA39|nr:CrpP-related protein [Allorhizobium pseudoryzae]